MPKKLYIINLTDDERHQLLDLVKNEDHRVGPAPKLDDKEEAWLIATACGTPPDGRGRWTMQLLTLTRWCASSRSNPPRTRPCAARSKKHARAVAEGGMVHFNHQPRVCLAPGRYAGPLR